MITEEVTKAALLSTKIFNEAVVTNTIAIVESVRCANNNELTYRARSSRSLLNSAALLLPSLRS